MNQPRTHRNLKTHEIGPFYTNGFKLNLKKPKNLEPKKANKTPKTYQVGH